jgi:hypothetical protein
MLPTPLQSLAEVNGCTGDCFEGNRAKIILLFSVFQKKVIPGIF